MKKQLRQRDVISRIAGVKLKNRETREFFGGQTRDTPHHMMVRGDTPYHVGSGFQSINLFFNS
jgi:hypothetical protein